MNDAAMTWEQKLAALQALTETHLCMRKPGDWYVDAYARDIGGDGFLTGTFGNGMSPAEAVLDDWKRITELPPGKYIVISANSDKEKRVRWNGFMWKEV